MVFVDVVVTAVALISWAILLGAGSLRRLLPWAIVLQAVGAAAMMSVATTSDGIQRAAAVVIALGYTAGATIGIWLLGQRAD